MKPFKLGIKFYIIFVLITLAPTIWLASKLQEILNASSIGYIKQLVSWGVIEAPTAVFFIVILFGIYESILWRIWPFHYLQRIPCVRGRYEGKITSNYNGGTEHLAIIEIQQSLSRISICLYTEKSSSCSLIANIGKNNKGNWFLAYIYNNNPKTVSNDLDMRTHDGCAHLEIFSKEQKINGYYFTDSRERPRYGQINIEFKTKILKGHF